MPSYRTISQASTFADLALLFSEKTSTSSCTFSSLLFCVGAFSDVVDSLVGKNLSGGKPLNPFHNIAQL